MPYATARDGTRIYYKDWGRGRPVALVHGWPLSSDTFDDVALALADEGYRAIFHDRRGFGRSDQPFDGYDYDSFTSDLEAVLDHAGASGPVALAGFSMGGGEVARFTSRNSGRVSHAVLIGSVVPFLLKTGDNPNGAPKEVFDGMVAGIKKDRADFFRNFFPSFYGEGLVSQAVLDDSLRQAMMAGLKPTLGCVRAFSETDFRPDLAAFTMPTLVVHGTADATVPIDLTARQVARRVPGARLVEYDGAHGIFASHKDRLIADILGFLGEAPAQAAASASIAEPAQ
ncbi:MAG TPA: alpha/beta hydrolase [Sphingomicrobium sp.]|nr:alpha/beta hydrolase [Sphingomicrobium sp.]